MQLKELSIFLVNTSLLTVCFLSANALFLLFYSELVWLFLYTTITAIAFFVDSSAIVACIIPVLILGATDCSLWILMIAGVINLKGFAGDLTTFNDVGNLLRAGRMLSQNKFIK